MIWKCAVCALCVHHVCIMCVLCFFVLCCVYFLCLFCVFVCAVFELKKYYFWQKKCCKKLVFFNFNGFLFLIPNFNATKRKQVFQKFSLFNLEIFTNRFFNLRPDLASQNFLGNNYRTDGHVQKFGQECWGVINQGNQIPTAKCNAF